MTPGDMESRDVLRWSLSFLAIAGLHVGAAAAALLWSPSHVAAPPPAAAIMVDLAPLPAAPVRPPSELPPAPEQVEAASPPPKPQPEDPLPKLDPVPTPPLAKRPVVILPVKTDVRRREPVPEPPKPVEKPEEKVEDKPPAPATTAPAAMEAPEAPKAAAPVEGAPSRHPSMTPATWQSALLGHLERHKRYPREAQNRHQEGVVYVRFTMNRKGEVLSRQLEEGTGYPLLDDEALALLDRAQPLPPPPSDVEGEAIELVVPVEFFIR